MSNVSADEVKFHTSTGSEPSSSAESELSDSPSSSTSRSSSPPARVPDAPAEAAAASGFSESSELEAVQGAAPPSNAFTGISSHAAASRMSEAVFEHFLGATLNPDGTARPWPLRATNIEFHPRRKTSTGQTIPSFHSVRIEAATPFDSEAEAVVLTRVVDDVRLLVRAAAAQHGHEAVVPVFPDAELFDLTFAEARARQLEIVDAALAFCTAHVTLRQSEPLRMFLTLPAPEVRAQLSAAALRHNRAAVQRGAGAARKGREHSFKALLKLRKGAHVSRDRLQGVAEKMQQRIQVQRAPDADAAPEEHAAPAPDAPAEAAPNALPASFSLMHAEAAHEDLLQLSLAAYFAGLLQPVKALATSGRRLARRRRKAAARSFDFARALAAFSRGVTNQLLRLQDDAPAGAAGEECAAGDMDHERIVAFLSARPLLRMADADALNLSAGALMQDADARTRTLDRQLYSFDFPAACAQGLLQQLARLTDARGNLLRRRYRAEFHLYRSTEKLDQVREAAGASAGAGAMSKRQARLEEKVRAAEQQLSDANAEIDAFTNVLVYNFEFARAEIARHLRGAALWLRDASIHEAQAQAEHWKDALAVIRANEAAA